MKLWENNLVKVILYDRTFSNPTVEVVDEGAKLAAKRILFSPSYISSILR